MAARGVVPGVYATARPEEDTAHPHVSVWIKSPLWRPAVLCGRSRWGGGRNRQGLVHRLKRSWHCSRIWEKNGIRIGQECELWGCQMGIMRRVLPGTNENTLTSAQHITHSVSKRRTVTRDSVVQYYPCNAGPNLLRFFQCKKILLKCWNAFLFIIKVYIAYSMYGILNMKKKFHNKY